MNHPRIQQGELAYWLDVIAAPEARPQASTQAVPGHIVESLRILRCIEDAEGGGLRITDKGLLALRMADPAAIHHR